MPDLRSQTAPNTVEQRLGIVMSVDHKKGLLTLMHSAGPCSQLMADPMLLSDLRVGGLVLALVKGAVVWALRPL